MKFYALERFKFNRVKFIDNQTARFSEFKMKKIYSLLSLKFKSTRIAIPVIKSKLTI